MGSDSKFLSEAKLKQILEDWDAPELIELIIEIYKFKSENRKFLSYKLTGKKLYSQLYEEYREKLEEALCPEGPEPLKLRKAKSIINEFFKITGDRKGYLEFLFLYVKLITKFIDTYGPEDASIYDSGVRTFSKLLQELKKTQNAFIRKHLIPKLKEFVKHIKGKYGYGYSDNIELLFEEFIDWIKKF